MQTTPAAPAEIKEELAPRLRWAITRMARRLRQEAGTDLGPSQVAALATVERHGPLSPSELAERERIKRPTATRIVRRLEEAGLVERVARPRGRPRLDPQRHPRGRALLKRLRARKTAYLASRLASSTPRTAATLERAAELMEGMLE